MEHSFANHQLTPGILSSIAILLISQFAGCSSQQTQGQSQSRYTQKQDAPPSHPVDLVALANVPDAVPVAIKYSKYGNPDSYEVLGQRYYTLKSGKGYQQQGIASWYGSKFHGHRTSSGEAYDMYAMTAAHKTLPLPTFARVTNLSNGRSIIVKINDRGPFHDDRLIDLSYAAATKLDIARHGTGHVKVVALEPESIANKAIQRPPIQQTTQQSAQATASGYRATGIYLQLGAFSERQNAEKLRNKLSSANFEGISISPLSIQDKKIYRVRIGPLQDQQSTDILVKMLEQHGVHSPSVVIN
ncbi:MAG: septal ring lytic transglycosylase RlpA family protein [Gammaproteobacteria bacterium]